MIRKTTTFSLGMIFSLGLATATTSLNAAIPFFSCSNKDKGADIIEVLHQGFTGILNGVTDADAVIVIIKKKDAEVGNLIEALLKFLVKEFKNDSNLRHDKKRSGVIIEDFCIKYFAKLGIVKSIQYKGILDRLKIEFSKYTPEQFNAVIHTLHNTLNLEDNSKQKAVAGVSCSLQTVKSK